MEDIARLSTDSTNCVRFRNLEGYYVDKYNRNVNISERIINAMSEIINMRSEDIDPNDESLMRSIKEYMNKLSIETMDDIISKIVNENFKTQKHYEFLVNEIILKAMNDVIAFNGIETDGMIPTDLYIKVIEQFYGTSIDGVTFESVLIKKIKEYFNKFIMIGQTSAGNNKSNMNKNNAHHVNNYKGLMNLIGTLFMYDETNYPLLFKVIDIIHKIIVDTGLKYDECDNFYDGYDRILSHFMKRFNINEEFIDDEIRSAFASMHEHITKTNESIITISEQNMKSRRNTVRKMTLNRLKKKVEFIKTFETKYN